jgi:hypothetical protein
MLSNTNMRGLPNGRPPIWLLAPCHWDQERNLTLREPLRATKAFWAPKALRATEALGSSRALRSTKAFRSAKALGSSRALGSTEAFWSAKALRAAGSAEPTLRSAEALWPAKTLGASETLRAAEALGAAESAWAIIAVVVTGSGSRACGASRWAWRRRRAESDCARPMLVEDSTTQWITNLRQRAMRTVFILTSVYLKLENE